MKNKNYLYFIIVNAAFFILGLNIPILSYSYFVINAGTCLFLYLSTKKKSNNASNKIKLKKDYFIAILILSSFCFLYYPTIYIYNLTNALSAFQGLTLPLISYLYGYSINFSKLPYKPFNFIYAILALVGGGTIFVYLSVINNPVSGIGIEIINRSVPNFWGGNIVNGTAMDIYSMLGLSCITIIIYIWNKEYKLIHCALITLFSFLLVCMGLYSSLALQGRRSIGVFLIVIMIAVLWKLKNIKNVAVKLMVFCGIVIIIIWLSTYLNTFLENLFVEYKVFRRFESNGFDTPRYIVWMEVLKSIFNNLLGGRSFQLKGVEYAHNIWLDVFYDGGLIPMLLLLSFHVIHIRPIIKIIFSKLPDILLICIMSLLIAFLAAFQLEPVLQLSTILFSISCCFFGLILRLYHDTCSTHVRKNLT